MIPGFSWSTDDDADAISPSVQPSRPEPVNGALVAEVDAPAAAPRQGDALVTATEWLSQARDLAANWLGGRGGPAPTELGADPTAEPIVVSRDDSPAAHDDGRVEQAQLGPSFVVGITSLLTIRYHQPFRRWLSRAADEADAKSRRSAIGNSPIVRGPHARI